MDQTIAQLTQAVNNHQMPSAVPQGPALLPEASCSVNLFFEVPGYGKAQATGRGRTGAEAVDNLRQTIAHTLSAFAPHPPPLASRTQRLSLLLACGLEKALAKDDGKLAERLTKAALLVLAGHVEEVVIDGQPMGVYRVRSQAEPANTVYDVQGRVCECQDSRRHAEDTTPYHCKHSLASLLVHRLSEQEAL